MKKKKLAPKKRKKHFLHRKTFIGFTIIELLVVTTILIILMGIAILAFSRSSVAARDARRKQDIAVLQQAIESYYEVYGVYPIANNFTGLMNDSQFAPYIANKSIQDPTNTGANVYTYSSDGATYQLQYHLEQGNTDQQSSGLTAPGTYSPTPAPSAIPSAVPTSTAVPSATSTPTRTPTPTATPCVVPTTYTGLINPCTGQSYR